MDTSEDFFIQTLHIVSSEWRFQSYRFVEDKAKRPNVTLVVVGLVPPHLGAGIIWSACLGVQHAFFGHF